MAEGSESKEYGTGRKKEGREEHCQAQLRQRLLEFLREGTAKATHWVGASYEANVENPEVNIWL